MRMLLKDTPRLRAAVVLCGLLLPGFTSAAVQTNKPNVVFILIDDMGYGDTACYQSTVTPVVPTPNIDRLAAQGIRFTHYYSTSPICSPSRTGLMSGSYPGRWRINSYLDNKSVNRNRNMADFADPQLPTIARAFKAAGYVVGHSGKWHLDSGRNDDDSPLPQAYGWDESQVSFEGLGNRTLINGDGLSTQNAVAEQGVLSWMDKSQTASNQVNMALAFLAAHTNQPCYLNLWPNDVHTAWLPAAGTWQKYASVTSDTSEQKFYAVLENLDVQLGRFLAGLDNLGLTTNTILVYASDNGAPGDGTAAFSLARNNGFRGRKGSNYEGGLRLPFMVRWPNRVPAGVVNSNTVLTGVDFLPTVCALAQVPLPANYLPDGEDMSPAILGQAQVRTKPIYWYIINPSSGPPLAMREGKWKVMTSVDKSTLQLYDLDTDPLETSNKASNQSALANSMADQVIAWWQTLPR